ncbi:MAG TPA: SRPBCC family protein [Acidimicrobiales bacterium]|nr:SRPBCC family protein [Acidimicrobiales bacterium]
MHGSVTVTMKADARDIWNLVSDVTRIGSYSPETFEAEWMDGATGPEVGARFRGHVRRNGRGPVYWTSCQVTESEPGRVFAFNVLNGSRPLNTWRYELEPRDGATDVTESFELAPFLPMRIYWALAGWSRGKTNERGMRQTLERIKAQVEGAATS